MANDDNKTERPASALPLTLSRIDLADGADAEFLLDLRGINLHQALHAIERMVAKPDNDRRSIFIRVSPAAREGGPAPFHVIGNRLRELASARRIASISPVPVFNNGPGFIVVIPGTARR